MTKSARLNALYECRQALEKAEIALRAYPVDDLPSEYGDCKEVVLVAVQTAAKATYEGQPRAALGDAFAIGMVGDG